MIRLILVIILAIVSISCIGYAGYQVLTGNTDLTGFFILILGCICLKGWKRLINTDDEVDMHIE